MRAKATAAIVIAAVLALPLCALAQEEDPGKLAAVQKRKFRMDHEIFVEGNVAPLDAFYKGVGPVGGYTLHFTDVLAWEVLRGSYSFTLHTALHDQLINDFGVSETKFEEMEWMVSSALMVTPFYGKLSFVNSAVMHTELFLLIGAAVGKFNDAFKPGPQGGLGLRFFLSEHWSVRFEGRYYYLISSHSTSVIDISLGLALSLGGTD